MGMVFWTGLFGGCGQTEVKQDNTITNSSEEGKEEGTAEEELHACRTCSGRYDLNNKRFLWNSDRYC